MALKSLIEGLAEDAIEPIGQMGGELLVEAFLLLIVLASAIVGTTLLTFAAYAVLVAWSDELTALLVLGGIFLAVATIVGALAFSRRYVSRAAAPAAGSDHAPREARLPPIAGAGLAQSAMSGAAAGDARDRGPEQVRDQLVSPMLDLLGERGMERERLAVAAGMTLAEGMRPLASVGVMLALGVAIGHLLRHHR